MPTSYEKLARILGTKPENLKELDEKMSALTGQHGVMDDLARQNDANVDRVLADLNLTRESSAEEIYEADTHRLIHLDQHLFELLDKPDLSKMANDSGKLGQVAFELYTPPKGLFIKKDKVVELLEKQPPQTLLDHFGYKTVAELVEKEGFASVVAALRFTQTTEWMHSFFDTAYRGLTKADFEEREVELKILDVKWLEAAKKYMEHKFHNISHLKEFGIIFVIPLPIDTPGETLRMFTLIMHYLHEVPFYTGLFRRFIDDPDFISKFQSLLRGDVPEGAAPQTSHAAWRIVQRYLAKDDPNDFRLHEQHVNPEAEHWFKVAQDFTRLARILGAEEGKFNIGYWSSLDFTGDFFKAKDGSEKLVSFDVIDSIMSMVKKGEIKYLYHQQEAIWNAIFAAYMGHEQMDELIEANIIKGFIEL
ncbi:MAG TPA: hypothetical protein VFK07_03105 [Candidatus Paceibacterota bacterium]|nr:hypothetical protein [Candidatus Paceibacterota bacterium]